MKSCFKNLERPLQHSKTKICAIPHLKIDMWGTRSLLPDLAQLLRSATMGLMREALRAGM
jgi:hypothetical protein